MRFQIAELREVFAAVVESARVGLCCCVHNLVCAHVAVLCECFAADFAVIGAFAGVTSFVGLEVAQLAETLTAGGFFAKEGFHTGVGAGMDVEMGFLVEGFVTAGDCTVVSFLRSWFLGRGGQWG